MKKHKVLVAVSTLAVAANLVLPNLAFGQSNQSGSVNIDCPTSTPASLVAAPQPVTFTSVTSPTSGTASTTDATASATANFPGGNTASGGVNGNPVTDDHLIRVQDTTSTGVDGCGLRNDWNVTATVITLHSGTTKALTNTGDTDYIPASSMHLITTESVNIDNIDNGTGPAITAAADSEGIFYDYYTTTGNPGTGNHARKHAAGTDFTDVATYSAVTSNTLNGTVPVIDHCGDGQNTDIYTGVAIDIDGGIHALQASGSYTGTIQYTMNPGSLC